MYLKITEVVPNADQPRKEFDEDALTELSESIRQFGVLQPLLFRRRGNIMKLLPANAGGARRRWQD